MKKKISTASSWPEFLLLLGTALLISTCLWPELDLIFSGWFYAPGRGFPLGDDPLFLVLHGMATYGARMLGVLLVLSIVIARVLRRPFCGLDSRAWLFLLLGLLLGPGLIANIGFKDHWGRDRPREVTEFGGVHAFSPAYEPQADAHKNGSFVAGDASFGFYLPSFGYVVSQRRSRRFFWTGMGFGGLFGLARIVMGAHFLSDVLFAALFMLLTSAWLHAGMFGIVETQKRWEDWLNETPSKTKRG